MIEMKKTYTNAPATVRVIEKRHASGSFNTVTNDVREREGVRCVRHVRVAPALSWVAVNDCDRRRSEPSKNNNHHLISLN